MDSLAAAEALTPRDAEDCSISATCVPALVKKIKEEYTSRLVDILDVSSES
jgi:hypothetical protein